jgi:hypothetical protein
MIKTELGASKEDARTAPCDDLASSGGPHLCRSALVDGCANVHPRNNQAPLPRVGPSSDCRTNTWDVLTHILAVEAGASFLSAGRNFRILVLDNDTEVPFITSDQPIINMLTQGGSWDVPKRIELYYPISPTQAMLYLEKSTPIPDIEKGVSIDEAHRYNMIMLDHSASRVFSNSEEYLHMLKMCVDCRN